MIWAGRLLSRNFWTPVRASIAAAGVLIAAVAVVFTVRWFDDGIEHVATFRLRGYPTAIAWAPDGKVLASISEFGGSLSLWDVATGRRTELGSVAGPYIWPSLSFVANGRQLLAPPRSDGSGKSAKYAFTLWDVATSTVLKDIEGPDINGSSRLNNPYRYDVSADGKIVAFVPIAREEIYIYEVDNWKIIKRAELSTRIPLWTFALSKDAEKAILAHTSEVSILDIESGQISTHRIYDDSSIRSSLSALALSPNGKYLAIAGRQGERLRSENPVAELVASDSLQVRSLADWALLTRFDRGGRIGGGDRVTWSADGEHIAVALGDLAIVYSVHSPIATARTIKVGTYVTGLSFSPTGNYLAVGEGEAIAIYKVAIGRG